MKNFFKKINKNSKEINFFKQKKSGFTIIETLVAIFILLITTTAPLTFAQSGLRTSFLARDQISAFFLAQESVEALKNKRDNNHLDDADDWLAGFGQCKPQNVGDTVSCDVGVLEESGTIPCSEDGCSVPLRYDNETGEFLLNGADLPLSKYTRTVHVTKINDDELQVIVRVSWKLPFLITKKEIVIQENIYKKY